MTPAEVLAWAKALAAICGAFTTAILAARRPWSRSRPAKKAQAAQLHQLSGEVAVAYTKATVEAGYEQLITRMAQLLDQRERHNTALMDVNRTNAEAHTRALESFQAQRREDGTRIANLEEDVAEFEQHAKKCELELAELRESVQGNEEAHRRVVRAMHDRYQRLAQKLVDKGVGLTVSDIGLPLGPPPRRRSNDPHR